MTDKRGVQIRSKTNGREVKTKPKSDALDAPFIGVPEKLPEEFLSSIPGLKTFEELLPYDCRCIMANGLYCGEAIAHPRASYCKECHKRLHVVVHEPRPDRKTTANENQYRPSIYWKK